MPAALTVATRYFAVDSDHDISGDTLSLSLDQTTWTPAAYVASPPARLTAAKPSTPIGLTRYWWSLLMGPGQTLIPAVGNDLVYGKLPDTPQQLYFSWTVNTPF